MQYFKNVDLTKMYPISEKAVRNWISAAKEGKLELTLYEKGDKTYVANTSQNAAIIDHLVNDRKKYMNSKARKTVLPSPEFYDIYNKEQIFDIITNLETYGEIPLKYSYFNGGAEYWDKYSRKLAAENVPNQYNRTVELLDLNISYLKSILDQYSKINVIEIGPGNGLPAKKFIANLIDEGRLGRYIALDVSQAMLDIVERNMKEWFGEKIRYEGYVKDIAHDRFRDILEEDAIAEDTCNLVIMLGSSMVNFRSPDDGWKTIHNSMGSNDLLVYTVKLDSVGSKRYFDFNIDPNNIQSLSPRHKLALDHLNIGRDMYEVEQFYDEDNSCRIIQVRLKIALTIEFNFGDFNRKIDFNKGDAIIVFQAKHLSTPDVLGQLGRNDFKILQASKTRDHEYLLVTSQIEGK